MVDFKFTGHINKVYVDVRFRTDANAATDGLFNIQQVQVGPTFQIGNNSGPSSAAGAKNLPAGVPGTDYEQQAVYQKFFANVYGTMDFGPGKNGEGAEFIFQLKRSSLTEFIEFAILNDLDLKAYVYSGVGSPVEVIIVADESKSASLSLH